MNRRHFAVLAVLLVAGCSSSTQTETAAPDTPDSGVADVSLTQVTLKVPGMT